MIGWWGGVRVRDNVWEVRVGRRKEGACEKNMGEKELDGKDRLKKKGRGEIEDIGEEE